MQAIKGRDSARAAARLYEAALSTEKQKQLGQFFTGLALGKLLAHLALNSHTMTVLDPMAGHGDLLDAVWEAAEDRDMMLERLDGIEIDERTAFACQSRLSQIIGTQGNPSQRIVTGSAFDPDVVDQLPEARYDLVITNPPYVRYQARKRNGLSNDHIRTGLEIISNNLLSGLEKDLWRYLIGGYSGLADLSIPSWLLASLMVRPSGRLALVVPATWRSRDYADLIRYLLLRCFALEYIVEDTQAVWFNNALVRTHLVVARRLAPDETAKPLSKRTDFSSAQWLQIAPEAANNESLVGRAFGSKSPEADLVCWLRNESEDFRLGIQRHSFDPKLEWGSLEAHISSRRWYQKLESRGSELRLLTSKDSLYRPSLPDAVRDVVPDNARDLYTLENVGIHVGQGLRSGCNQFFYVTVCSTVGNGLVRVRSSPTLGSNEFTVPEDALRPVLRRQAEVPILLKGQTPPGRVLDLRGWVLPEDANTIIEHLLTYHATGESVPQTMPDELADFVRLAALSYSKGTTNVKRIPDLSAVRSNVRIPKNGSNTPRFWYMIPDFAPRHLPSAFVARVNHNLPWSEVNLDPPLLIDANFCSFWSTKTKWTRFSLKAMLNSVWCRTLMEALGTPLGGGALKLEASHLRRMPIPQLSKEAIENLHMAGMKLTEESSKTQETIDRIVLRGVLGPQARKRDLLSLAVDLKARARQLSLKRRKILL